MFESDEVRFEMVKSFHEMVDAVRGLEKLGSITKERADSLIQDFEKVILYGGLEDEIDKEDRLTITLSEIEPLSSKEKKLAEMAYRRGYCDGWIKATMEMPLTELEERMYTFWENELHEWKHIEPKDKEVHAPCMKRKNTGKKGVE